MKQVKIVESTEEYWYRNRIGGEFYVYDYNDKYYAVYENFKLIQKVHAVEVKNSNKKSTI